MMDTRSEPARTALRAADLVRLVLPHEEGSAAADMPGVYGFTGSPGLAAPLFAERRYRNFEIHHLRDGSIAIVGFVTAAVAAALRHTHAPVALTLYPDIDGDSTEIVAVPYGRIEHHRQYSVRNAAGLDLRVRPMAESAPA